MSRKAQTLTYIHKHRSLIAYYCFMFQLNKKKIGKEEITRLNDGDDDYDDDNDDNDDI